VFLVFCHRCSIWDLSFVLARFPQKLATNLAFSNRLVFTTTMAVMLAAHFMLGFPWGPAFVLGAVLGPTDTVAAAAMPGKLSPSNDAYWRCCAVKSLLQRRSALVFL